jgi:hypothetical protein
MTEHILAPPMPAPPPPVVGALAPLQLSAPRPARLPAVVVSLLQKCTCDDEAMFLLQATFPGYSLARIALTLAEVEHAP